MKYKIGVMGKAGRSKGVPEELVKAAEVVGQEIARQGCVLVTGACMGVPRIAAEAASDEGGQSLGYSPAKNLQQHIEPPISYPSPPENMELIFTGYGKTGRNVLSIFECDGVIFIGGGIGTLNEFSIAAHEGKVMGVLTGVGGFIEKNLAEAKKETKEKSGGIIITDKDPKRLVQKVIEEIKKREKKPRKEIPITFKNERGKQLVGILHLPKNPRPPLVIMAHGFGGTKTDQKYIELARALQKEGIVAFRFDFEGCGDSEGNFQDMTVAKEVSDLNSALKAVLKEVDLDSRRIALVSGSLGTVISTLFVKKFNIPVKTLVFWSQAFNQKGLLRVWQTEEEIQKWEEVGYLIKGSKKMGIDYLKENKEKDYSPLVSEIDLPILLIQGAKDKDVPPELSQELASSYRNIELKLLPGADHKFSDPGIREKLVRITTDWLKKYL